MTNTNNDATAIENAIRTAARQLRDSRFNAIPSVIFENDARVKEGEYDEVLTLVGGGTRRCPECEAEVEVSEDEDGDEVWVCPDCEATNDSTCADVDDLRIQGSDLAWPCAHGYLFWTEDFDDSNFVNAAVEAGFLVFEPQDFNGFILGIDGGGYDFVDEHWVPLYKALGLKWHEAE